MGGQRAHHRRAAKIYNLTTSWDLANQSDQYPSSSWDSAIIVTSAALVSSGGAIYPIGWDNREVKESCGNISGPYKLGTCHLSWSVYMLGSSVALLLLCFYLSFYSSRDSPGNSFRSI